MNDFRGFIKKLFPINKWLPLKGVLYGFALSIILWFPFPSLISVSKRAVIFIIITLCTVILWLIYKGRLFPANRDHVGWTALGTMLAGTIFYHVPLDQNIYTNQNPCYFFCLGILVLLVHIISVYLEDHN